MWRMEISMFSQTADKSHAVGTGDCEWVWEKALLFSSGGTATRAKEQSIPNLTL